MKATFLAVATIATASGCRGTPSGSSGTSSTKTAESTSVPAATTTAGPSGDASSAQTLETRDDLVSPQAVAWDSWRLTSPDTIEIVFISGPADCVGASTEVIETDQDVTINLTVGSLPGVTECRAIAVQSRCVVTLEKELGDRQVRQDS